MFEYSYVDGVKTNQLNTVSYITENSFKSLFYSNEYFFLLFRINIPKQILICRPCKDNEPNHLYCQQHPQHIQFYCLVYGLQFRMNRAPIYPYCFLCEMQPVLECYTDHDKCIDYTMTIEDFIFILVCI